MSLFAVVTDGLVSRVIDTGRFTLKDVAPDVLDGIACPIEVRPGWQFKDDEFLRPEQEAPPIQQLKADLKAVVDSAAETERLKYITPGHGQAMTYQQKVTEAQAYKAATNPQASDYPILSSEVGITAETIGGVADVVLAAFAQWQQIGAMIESIRLGAKRDIDAAEDEATARAIVEAIEWPQPAL